ncbi:alpha-protein kinase 2 isoform X2 [Ahaetulla prasina]|uniref:alpha-protein kinase 2 isoform X2 n=1 Tax=Ahaetulla prasina TaxID=499056 RepID=UPI00264885CE|nr:alpha-protein kinase 2 isoform X2 [Ahaetulla prasina]
MEINNVSSLKKNDSFILSTTQSVSGLFIYDVVEECWNSIEGKVDGSDSSQVDSMLASQIYERTDSCCFNAKVLTACQTTEYAKTCEKGSLSKVLKKDMLSKSHTRVPLEDKFYLAENSTFTADSGLDLDLDGNFIEATEVFQNDFLEDTECSDVMKEEIYEDWEAKLKFLLESDEEEELIPSTDCDACSYFLSEMPRLFQVSDDTMPMETTIGFSRHPSKSKEVAVRSNLTACRPSTLQTGMTLTVGQQQSMNLGMKTKEKQKQPVIIKNNYSRTGEENRSNSCSSCHVSALRSQGVENGTSAMKSPSRRLDVSSATAGKQDTAECRNFSGEIKSQRVMQVGKKTMRGKSGLPHSAEDSLKALPTKPLHKSKLHTIQRETNHLGSATSLHRQGKTTLGLTNVADNDTLFCGQGSEQRDRLVGEWITGPSEESQAAEESAMPKIEQQEINAETSASISNNQELFTTDPTVDERLVLAPSHGVAENSVLPKVHRKTGFQMGDVTLENSVALDGRGRTQEAEEQKPGWDQTPHLPMVGNRTSCDGPDALCDIPVSMLDVPMEETRAGKAHELNRINILCDIPRTQHPSEENFQSILESTELKDRDAGLSTMCELSQRLLYENGDWDDDFSCTSREVKRVAAETASAKEVRGLNITADVSGGQLVPENLTEDNQHVSELTTEMQGLTDFSLLKTDETYSHPSKVNSMTLPVEPVSIDLGSVYQRKREKPSAYFIRSDLQKRKYPNKQCEAQHDNHGSIQKSVDHEDTVLTEKAFQRCEQEPTYRFVDVPDDPLEPGQEFLLKQLPNNHGQFSYTEQNVNWDSGHIAKQANEIPLKEHQSPANRSRINDCPLKEDSSRNFCGKIMAPLISRKQTSVTAINRSAKQENQGKESKSELNAKRDRSCGIYHDKSNNRNFKAVSDAQNHIYRIPESNSLMATEPKNDWQALETTSQENIIERNALRPIFTASYKVRFFTEVLLEINKSVKTNASQKCTDCVASVKPTLLESQNSQQLVSEKNSLPAKHLDESMKNLGSDLACSPSEMNTTVGSNTVQSSTITSNEDYGIDQKTQNGRTGNLTVPGQDISNQKRASESCNADILMLSEHVGQTESIRSQMDSSMDAKAMTSQQDTCKGTEENQHEGIMQSEKENDMLVAPDFEEAEIELYMRALLGSEQGPPVMVSHGEYQKRERQSQSKIMPDEMDTKETEKLVEDDLEEVEVEPYMRALLDSEPMYSWHEYPDCMPPFMEFCNEQAAVLVGRLKTGCTVTITDPNQSRAFSDGERQNSSGRGMGILERPLPSASEDNHHSEKALPLAQTEPCTLGTNEGDISALENERTISLEALEISKPLSPHKSAEAMKNGHEITNNMMPKVPKKTHLETKESICNDASWRTEADLASREEKREEQKMLRQKDNRAPRLLRKIHAELFPDFSGNVKLCCQFGEIHSDSTITWTKDSKLLARVHRSASDDLPVSLAIVQAGKKDQGLYHCCLKNIYGKAISEFNLTSEVLEHLSILQDVEVRAEETSWMRSKTSLKKTKKVQLPPGKAPLGQP